MANLITGQTHHYGLGGLHGANSGADAGSAHSPSPLAIAVVSPGDKTLDRVAFIVSRLCRKGLNIF
ncbi:MULTISPECIES: hypothetical protein [Moorena]|uniref:hypothetical protein n=1 Tax=Moorena TaxID=1155738 RepID=UPI001055D8AE|nr:MULTISPECIES: hypothetical protein [Moorena]NEQ15116.1 hypothetical protein [Moorena sp. SIO3E2]NEP34316.1 hypothetical protein [Moorena sp. SIO3B2]NER92169.1 hypothetical protein [Moorena sp. SIO3A2]NES46376.1 hypothetical protein [Moorena sp. SIO2C4]NET63807.1 hypothetical protein [Moorena sp. SIO1G6]